MPVRHLATLACALMLTALQYRLWVGEGGIVDTRKLEQQVGEESSQNALLRGRNEAADAEVRDLKAGGPAIEAQARRLLGMIRPGETFYLVVSSRQ